MGVPLAYQFPMTVTGEIQRVRLHWIAIAELGLDDAVALEMASRR